MIFVEKKFWIFFLTILAACIAAIFWAANQLEATGLINHDPADLVSMALFVGLFLCVPLAFFASAFAAIEVEFQLWWHNYQKSHR